MFHRLGTEPKWPNWRYVQYAQKLVVGQNFGHEIRLDFAISDWKYAFSKRYMRSRHKYRVQKQFSSLRIIFVLKTIHVSVIISDEMKPRPEWEKIRTLPHFWHNCCRYCYKCLLMNEVLPRIKMTGLIQKLEQLKGLFNHQAKVITRKSNPVGIRQGKSIQILVSNRKNRSLMNAEKWICTFM